PIKPKGIDPIAAGGAFVVALIIGVFVRSMLIGSMSNIHHAMAAIDYLQKNTVKLIENRDTFLFMNVKRRPKGGGNNRGGGHGGGGHGGGGGSF
ncbi:MAG: TPM domain-containing protein, partial [Selenomonadaceae bacterium]|nr:TPM domain-containing protein [Selenomonadaceae bacterium]